MDRIFALAHMPAARLHAEMLRSMIVTACALSLILAGNAAPF
jgi:hypothetical protein